ncbi:MAG: two-component regulator propeller domain-containing protein, partial [Bacteroidota bacterium]|nr:two-component regulator propeller domain-containing protein [Bacteroidota bacterium]
MKKISLLLFLAHFILLALAQAAPYQSFDNVALNNDASVVNCFIQDKQGGIWMGTDKGLFSYNGHTLLPHFPFSQNKQESGSMINCGTMLDDERLCLGADNGLLFYNLKTDLYETRPVKFPTDIRSMARSGRMLWIGTLNGLYRYAINSNRIENVSQQKNIGIPHKAIYSILQTADHTLYVGTYNGLCALAPNTDRFQTIALPVYSPKNNLLVNSLLEDAENHCIWIGTEGYLFRYFPQTKKIEHIPTFDGNSIKSLAIDQNKNLLLGTDNGLYIYDLRQNEVKHLLHDSRYSQSLSNNIVWSIFIDKQNNTWIGTDYGVSLARSNKEYQYVPISRVTGMGDGNNLQVIFRDSRNNFWYGGTNGLIFSPADGSGSTWYKMGESRNPISHNRIRCIYEDHTHNLWVATDGSINRFDYSKRQFVHYNIVDKSYTRNAQWAYNITEDKRGRLWIATCLGGIFVVDKAKLLANAGKTYIAEQNFYKNGRSNGLSDNFINQMLMDLQGNIWALTYNAGFNKIDTRSGRVAHFNIKPNEPGKNASCMIRDREGYIWFGYNGGLTRLNSRTNERKAIEPGGLKNLFIRVLTEEEGHIWVTTSEGIFVLDKKSLQIHATDLINKSYSCSFYDTANRQIYLGGVDGFLEFSPSISNQKTTPPAITLTALYVNDHLFKIGKDYDGPSIRYADEATLKYNQNNISFEFSDLNFSREKSKNYLYRLDGVDDEWRSTQNLTDKITYTNLSPGRYNLSFGRMAPDGSIIKSSLDFRLIITPPWYLTV